MVGWDHLLLVGTTFDEVSPQIIRMQAISEASYHSTAIGR